MNKQLYFNVPVLLLAKYFSKDVSLHAYVFWLFQEILFLAALYEFWYIPRKLKVPLESLGTVLWCLITSANISKL